MIDNKNVDAIMEAFYAPFESHEIKTRQQGNSSVRLSYITVTSVTNRLNSVVGRQNWKCSHKPIDSGSNGNTHWYMHECTISVRLSGEWIEHTDIGGCSNPDKTTACQGSWSDSLKRAAAIGFGIGAHLRGVGIPAFDRADYDSGYVDPMPENPPASTAKFTTQAPRGFEPIGHVGEMPQAVIDAGKAKLTAKTDKPYGFMLAILKRAFELKLITKPAIDYLGECIRTQKDINIVDRWIGKIYEIAPNLFDEVQVPKPKA